MENVGVIIERLKEQGENIDDQYVLEALLDRIELIPIRFVTISPEIGDLINIAAAHNRYVNGE